MQDDDPNEDPPADQWIVEIQLTLGCVNNNKVKTCSICRVPERIGEAEANDKDKGYSYRPQFAAIGPFHRGTRSDLQIMEETKWRSMHKLLRRPTHNNLELETVKICSEAIKEIESIIRASYGEKIDMAAEELSRIMLLDACFLLELLLMLTENNTDPPLDDQKRILRLLTDLTLLENQIPFIVLTTLSSKLFPPDQAAQQQQLLASLVQLSQNQQLSPQKVASLFECNVAGADFSEGVYHFLHLIHLCSADPYNQEDHRRDPLQLERYARKLQAFGITMKASSKTNDANGNNNAGIVADALREFVDKFKFKIEFNAAKRELIIPTLHIKEATEVKWRNLIAWEQCGLIGIGYKFTSYAYFFKGLVCSVHDVQLLKEKGVIEVHKEAKDEDLVIMFQSITTGAERMDGRYGIVCEGLNEAKAKGVVGCCVLIFRMVWHYWRRFLEWLRRGFISSLLSFIDIYLGTPWKFIGVVVGAALLALTITQTIYAIRAVK